MVSSFHPPDLLIITGIPQSQQTYLTHFLNSPAHVVMVMPTGLPLSTTNTPQRSRAGSFDAGSAANLLMLQRSNLLLQGDDFDEVEGSRPVSYREAQPLPHGPFARLNAPQDALAPGQGLASGPGLAPGQELVYVPNEMYTGGVSLAPMAPRPRSARIDPDPPGCLPPPREKRTGRSHRSPPMVHFDSTQMSSSSSIQKEMIDQPSSYYPPQPPYAATKEPGSYRRPRAAGNGCQDHDRNEDCDDCCDDCCDDGCVPSNQRNRRRRNRQDHYIHYNPQIWIDGIVRDTLESDQIEPIDNYQTQLFSMVRANPQGKHYPPIVVDDNMASLKKDLIIHPYGRYKILWDTFIGLLIVYSITEIPMIVAFRSDTPN